MPDALTFKKVTIRTGRGRVIIALVASADPVQFGEQLALLLPHGDRVKSVEAEVIEKPAAFVLDDGTIS